jgi:hypothetical protein
MRDSDRLCLLPKPASPEEVVAVAHRRVRPNPSRKRSAYGWLTRPGALGLRETLQQPLDHQADRQPNARSAPTHAPRGGRVNADFNLSQKLDAVHTRLLKQGTMQKLLAGRIRVVRAEVVPC